VRVLHVASEVEPLSKTGGLADVAAALPRALVQLGVKVAVVTPRYRSVDVGRWALARRLRPLQVQLGHTVEVTVYEGNLPGSAVTLYAVDHPLFDRDGVYGDKHGEFGDNWRRFGLLSRAALHIGHELWGGVDVVHAHDWQAGLAPLWTARGVGGARGSVLTIHNMAFLGLAPPGALGELGLPPEVWSPEGLEFYGKGSLLKAGIVFADRVTTVSPRYAREIRTPEGGYGMDGLLRARAGKLSGILNGVDYQLWSPERDPRLPANYRAGDLAGKTACKAALQRELELPVRPDVPLFGAISRITDQKGWDLLVSPEVEAELAALDAQIVILGSGDGGLEHRLRGLAQRLPSKLVLRTGYDDGLAHRIMAGSDLYLMPSRFEPCGLTQLYALRYGTVPVVRATGGLDDSVVDHDAPTGTGTGFKFHDYAPHALLATMRRAAAVFRQRVELRGLIQRGMAMDFSWSASAKRYLTLYQEIVKEKGGK